MISAGSSASYPWVMIRPRPGPATRAAMVAVAHTCTKASRMPEKMIGSASGSSTRRSTSPSDMPIPRAASTVSRSTSRMPTQVLVMIGGSANRASVTSVASPARPNGPRTLEPNRPRESSASRATIGIARPMLDTLTASVPPRPRCPSQTASGRPTTIAIATETTVSSRCS